MVDAERVSRLLQRIRSDCEYLAARSPAKLEADFDAIAATKYVFVTAIEGCTDVAQHCCASEGWRRPESNADAVRELGRRGVLSEAIAESVARAVGFRNLLVHGYVEVDDGKVIEFLTRVPDLVDFVRSVAAWIESGD